ncbi:hypothetical protein TNCV_100861 [Trichonephila clavipes]|nr:hypothetical protein TNCV_100861 [Trichonephila clavipes]
MTSHCHRNCLKFPLVIAQPTPWDSRTRSNKLRAVASSGEVTTIPATKSLTVATGVSYTGDFRWPQKKKSKESKSGECGGQVIGLPHPIHFPRYVASGVTYTPTLRESIACRQVPTLCKIQFGGSKPDFAEGPKCSPLRHLEVVAVRSRKTCCCTILHELHVLVCSDRYSLQQLREDGL